MRLIDLFEQYDVYTDQFYTTIDSLWSRGRSVDDITQISPDAELHLEDDEFEYEWRYAMVPLSIFPNFDFPEEQSETDRRLAFIKNNPHILQKHPILIGYDTSRKRTLPLLDGHHRVYFARNIGMSQIPAVIGKNRT